MKETAIYIHIPFCDHKCIYCDFYSITPLTKTLDYFECLKKEIEFYALKESEGREIISIYFGGGTPSLMHPGYIQGLIETIKRNFNVRPEAEISLETNPGTVDKSKLADFRRAGVNRLSIGVQSFNNSELKFLTRIHNAALAEGTVYYALDSGIENVNIDLIFNLPDQSDEIWRSNLEKAISLPVKHISAYSLILEPGTILNKMVIDGKAKIQNNSFDAGLYEYAINFLEKHGFSQYEVSNFAKEGFECVHNNAYWKYKDYLSFGASAHSFIGNKRWWNYSGLSFYLKSVIEKGNAEAGAEYLNGEQMLQEYVMLALRSGGIELNEFYSLFGKKWIEENRKELSLLNENGLIIYSSEKIKLTKKGYLLCDEILSRLN